VIQAGVFTPLNTLAWDKHNLKTNWVWLKPGLWSIIKGMIFSRWLLLFGQSRVLVALLVSLAFQGGLRL
jgi:hypothetical protein